MKKGQGPIDNFWVIPIPDADPFFPCLTSFDPFFAHLPLSMCGSSLPYAGTGFANQSSADSLNQIVQSGIDDAASGYAHLAWPRVQWGIYNIANGETRPAIKE